MSYQARLEQCFKEAQEQVEFAKSFKKEIPFEKVFEIPFSDKTLKIWVCIIGKEDDFCMITQVTSDNSKNFDKITRGLSYDELLEILLESYNSEHCYYEFGKAPTEPKDVLRMVNSQLVGDLIKSQRD